MDKEKLAACRRAADRIADLVVAIYVPAAQQKAIRQLMATITWSEIIASELGIDYYDDSEVQS